MRLPGNRIRRPGASLVESAIVFPVLIFIILVMFDLSLCLFRYHLIVQAAVQGARQASVHGSYASVLGSWGPDAIGPSTGTSGTPLVLSIQPYLTMLDPDSLTVQAAWPDGSNEPDNRVQVTVTSTYQPLTTLVFGNHTVPLRASSTMPITH